MHHSTDVRAAVRQYITTSKVSQAKFARKVGVSAAALNQYLKGQYQGDSELIESKCRQTLGVLTERAATTDRVKAGFVRTSIAERVEHVCGHAQMARDLGVIVGPPGLGKTMALKRWAASSNMAVWVTVQVGAGYPKAVLTALAQALRLDAVGSQMQLWQRCYDALRDTERLLIFDEAQHLQADTLEMLRQLQDDLAFGQVWCGNPKVLNRVRAGSSAAFAQIWSRVGVVANLDTEQDEPFREDVESLCDARGFAGAELKETLYRIAREGGWLRSVDKVLKLANSYGGDAPTDVHVRHALTTLGWVQQ